MAKKLLIAFVVGGILGLLASMLSDFVIARFNLESPASFYVSLGFFEVASVVMAFIILMIKRQK
ncbi:hypothetical protein [Staphylospora marina]|uniref:hypothetical protein n=1 Tax=Staphylospora marina TaxID=2490858 RepID=UPI000F5C0A03|nr:hypothetical protein [Staphylospora marina]